MVYPASMWCALCAVSGLCCIVAHRDTDVSGEYEEHPHVSLRHLLSLV